MPDLVAQIDGHITQISGDGGYDSHDNYQLLADQSIHAVIPPRRDACIAQHGNSSAPPIARDEVVRAMSQEISAQLLKQAEEAVKTGIQVDVLKYKSAA